MTDLPIVVFETILSRAGLKPEQLTAIRAEASRGGKPLDEAAVDSGVITREKLVQTLSSHFRVRYVSLADDYDPDVLQTVPETVIKKYGVVPISLREKRLVLGMVNPVDFFAVDYVRMITGHEVETVGVLGSEFGRIVEQHFAFRGMESLVRDISLPDVAAAAEEAVSAGSGPVAKLVDTLLTEAVKMRASDIHVEPQDADLVVRFRVDGLLKNVEILPKQIQPNLVGRIKVMSGMDIGERRMPQDGRIDLRVLERDLDLRVSSLPGKYGEKLVLRVLDKSSFLLGLDQIGLERDVQIRLEEITAAPNGLFLVTGPTGSGKSTTLYSLLNRMRSPTLNILTLEDPIEYDLLSGKRSEAGITQVQINPRIGLDFATGLRACLRQDPDVILLGEVRDRETADVAFTTALTGHFVLSSLHTNDAPSTVARLLDMQVEPFLVSASLRGVLAQRLVRLLCRECREAYKPPKRLVERLAAELPRAPKDPQLFRPKGCRACGGTGYRGRAGIYEFLEITEPVAALINDRASLADLRAAARKQGMRTLRQAGLEATFRGLTTAAEVFRTAPVEPA